jgi:hypothetical protein
VTRSTFKFANGQKLSLDKRCKKDSWTWNLISRAANRLGCNSQRTTCTPGESVLLCQDVCTKLVALAQARCMDMPSQMRLFSAAYSKSMYKCCSACTRFDKFFGLCPY